MAKKIVYDFASKQLAEVDMTQSEIDALVLEVSVPAVVSMRQARMALNEAGLLLQVNNYISMRGVAAYIEWEYATEVKRDNALISEFAAAAGMTDNQIDELFKSASLF